MLYSYKAYVVKVYDGDTITVNIDLGMNIVLRNQKIRLYGINTPEVRGENKENGFKARDWVREQILDKDIIIETIKDKEGKYGRLLGIIYTIDCPLYSINNQLVDRGLAEVNFY